MNSTKVMRQAKLNSWAESIRDQQEGSLTVAEWCDFHNITKASPLIQSFMMLIPVTSI